MFLSLDLEFNFFIITQFFKKKNCFDPYYFDVLTNDKILVIFLIYTTKTIKNTKNTEKK